MGGSMLVKNYLIKSKLGLQLRTVGLLVNKIQHDDCNIILKHNGNNYNAKSILGLMSAGVKYGQEVMFVFDGKDEKKTAQAIDELLADPKDLSIN